MPEKLVFQALPPSANSGVIRTILDASGIPYDEENAWGKTRTPEYIAKFFNNCCPAIEDTDGTCVCESAAALRYLCLAYPDKAGKYFPGDHKKRAEIDAVLDFIGTSICKFIGPAVYPTLQFPAYPGTVAGMESTKQFTEESQKESADVIMAELNNKYAGILLKDTKFLCGDEPTIADFRFGPMLSQVKVCLKLPERIETYLKDFYAIEGVENAMKPVDDFNKQHWKTSDEEGTSEIKEEGAGETDKNETAQSDEKPPSQPEPKEMAQTEQKATDQTQEEATGQTEEKPTSTVPADQECSCTLL